MNPNDIQNWLQGSLYIAIPIYVVFAYALYSAVRFLLARGAYNIALRSKNVYDDLMVDQLQPFRFAWLVPLSLLYYFSDFLYGKNVVIFNIVYLLIIWVTVDFILSLLSGINEIYKNNPRYTGVSVAGYIGVVKVLVVIAAVVLNIVLLFDVEPSNLVAGVGAWLAVLLLIFRDTILSFVASVQISSQVLIKEGDMIEVSAFNTFGVVKEVNLRTIVIQNFDNTITNVPTDKIIDTGFKNYRKMLETKARQMQRSISLDLNSIKYCDKSLLERLENIDLIKDYVNEKSTFIKNKGKSNVEFPASDSHVTNLQLYSHYAESYLRNRKDIRLKG
ncbi:MAG TPA: mechanosensitive ion channel domain-containing protein, partial [Anaerolineales bacterium]|nr:mechanosensitive ion channel domain-containing protein [Anaerolineales bacterium]